MKFLFLFLSFVFFNFLVSAQMVNIESMRIYNDSDRFVLNTNLLFKIQVNNDNHISDFSGDFLTKFKSKNLKEIYYLIGSFNQINTNDKQIVNNSLLHFRFNYLLSHHVRFEVFTQMQNNLVLNLDYRHLLGLGSRFVFFSSKKLIFNMGATYMLENEKLMGGNESNQRYHRLSSYVSLQFLLPDNLGKISTVTYYQPLFFNWIDYRLANQTELSFSFNKKISFITQFNYYFDAMPPNEIRKESYELKNGLKLNF